MVLSEVLSAGAFTLHLGGIDAAEQEAQQTGIFSLNIHGFYR